MSFKADSETLIKIALAAARAAAEEGDTRLAEARYKQALQAVEEAAGLDSPSAGVVLIALAEFYESRGREDDAEPLRQRVRSILLLHADEVHEPSDDRD